MASKICTVRASDPSIEQRFNMLTGGVGLGMAAELLGGGKPSGGRKSAGAADKASRGGTSGAICGGIQPGIIISGKGSGAVNSMSTLRSALEAVVEESGSETDSSASHGWEELERTCAAMDSNNVQIDCIDLTNMLEEGVALADSDASNSEDDNNENRCDSDDESTNADKCTPHFSAAAPASRPAARPASRLSHTFSPINRLHVTAAAESPPPNLHRRSSFSGASESNRLGNANESNHADSAARNSHGGKYVYSGKYYSRSHSLAQCHSDGSPRLPGSPAECGSEGYGPHSGPLSASHSGPLSGAPHSGGSPFCGAPQSESPHSGPLRHGFGSSSSLNSSHNGSPQSIRPNSGSPVCGAPRSECLPSGPHTDQHSGPLRHGDFKPSPCHVLLRQSSAGDVSHTPTSVTVSSAAARLRPTSSGESGATGEGRPENAVQNNRSTVAPPSLQRPSVPTAVGNSAAAGGFKPGGVTVLVKKGANPAAIEAYLKLKAQRGR
ncbi:unnamed protein product [Closterium sp. Yama58-4]|nr:unnamed protein product [Closterium sp. Yama58-4]